MSCALHHESKFLHVRVFTETLPVNHFKGHLMKCAEETCTNIRDSEHLYWTDLDSALLCNDCTLNKLYVCGYKNCRQCYLIHGPLRLATSNTWIHNIFVKQRNATSKRANPE
jgi:hypothetical protein